MVRVRNINLEGLFQFMSLTSANWKSLYNSFLYEKKAVNSGIESLTSNLQLSTLSTKLLSHFKESILTLSQFLGFMDIYAWTFLEISWTFLNALGTL